MPDDSTDTVRVVVADTYHETYEIPEKAVEDGLDAVKEAIENGAEKVDEAKHYDPLTYRRKDNGRAIED